MINPETPESRLNFDNTKTAFLYRSDSELYRASFIFSIVKVKWISGLATALVSLALKIKLPVLGLIRRTVFRHFCGGETMEAGLKMAERLGNWGVQAILDYAVEGENREEDFDHALDVIVRIFDLAKISSHVPYCVFKMTALADASLLSKVGAGIALSAAEQSMFARSKDRVMKICLKARETNTPVLIDAEETWIQEPIHVLAMDMMKIFNKEKCLVYNTYQMYRKDMRARLESDFRQAESEEFLLGVKLVRGAYMEKERSRAASMGYTDPIHPGKTETDCAFDAALEFCVSKQHIHLICGSHNEQSNMKLTHLMQEGQIPPETTRIWFSQLLGMSDHISFNLASMGFRVVKYVPFGPVHSVIPYLIRRAEENTSVTGQSNRELLLIRREIARRKSARQVA